MEDILTAESTHHSLKHTSQSSSTLRDRLCTIKVDQVDQFGNTLLHQLVIRTTAPTPVYIFAECGVPINKLNKVGESALHIAVKANKLQIVEALLQCGADPNTADKIGVTPAALCSSPEMRALMSWFQPGLHQAVTSADFGAVCKLLKNWVSVTSKSLGDNRSLLDLSTARATDDVYVLRCMQKIRDSHTQSMLIHAVLADNVKKVKELLENTKMRTVNCRYKGERSLLSIAIENKNTELTKLLLDHGVKTNGRVRHRQLPEGNTALIRAIKHRASLPFIQWYISTTQGQTIAKRNIARMTAYEVAESCERADITSFINQYIDENIERLKVPLTVQFYGSLHKQLHGISQRMEVNGIELFRAACCNDLKTMISSNHFNYQDRNGYTALHKAVASGSVQIIKEIGHTRPVLKGMADNHGRYPLHLTFLLPEDDMREEILRLLLQSNAENYEYATDKDGKNPADYKHFEDEEKQSILRDILTAPF